MGSDSMFGAIDPVATEQTTKELRQSPWELGSDTPQRSRPPVSNLGPCGTHFRGNGAENTVAGEPEIDSVRH